MARFIINFVFGFAALLLFVVSFSVQLGLLGSAIVTALAYMLMDYFLQHSWELVLDIFVKEGIVASLLKVKEKVVNIYKLSKEKVVSFFRKKEVTKVELLPYV